MRMFDFLRSGTAAQAVLLSIGALISGYGVYMSFLVNFNAGLILVLAVGLFLLTAGAFYRPISLCIYTRVGLRIALGGICVSALFAAALGVYGCRDNPSYREDAVIVLGCGVRGEVVSGQLASRLEAALRYYRKNPNALIVVSGGQGKGEDITEALAMERYLVERGVPKDSIIKEERSTSTYTNLLFSKGLFDDRFDTPYKTVIISSDYHIYRAIRLSKRLGLDCTHVHGNTAWYEMPVRYSREILAVAKSLLGV